MTLPEKLLYASALGNLLSRAPAKEAVERAHATVLAFRRLLNDEQLKHDCPEAAQMLASFAEDP